MKLSIELQIEKLQRNFTQVKYLKLIHLVLIKEAFQHSLSSLIKAISTTPSYPKPHIFSSSNK